MIEGYAWLEIFLDKLEQKQRYVFEKIFFYNVKNKTIARNLKVSAPSVTAIRKQEILNLDKMLKVEGFSIPPNGEGV